MKTGGNLCHLRNLGIITETNRLDIPLDRDINAGVMNDRPLQDQVAVVTGAGRRMGRVIALTLARAGANVVVHYNESKEGAQSTLHEIESLGGQAITTRADVSRPKQVAAMFRAVEKHFGRLDLLVNNAGIFFPVKWDKLSEDD